MSALSKLKEPAFGPCSGMAVHHTQLVAGTPGVSQNHHTATVLFIRALRVLRSTIGVRPNCAWGCIERESRERFLLSLFDMAACRAGRMVLVQSLGLVRDTRHSEMTHTALGYPACANVQA